jgi:GH35 family endo-1,4-beta-xylanase
LIQWRRRAVPIDSFEDVRPMGVMRFLAPLRESLAHEVAPRIYVAGADSVPWRSKFRWAGDVLELVRDVAESGSLYVPWPVTSFGEVCLSTASLIERDEPYLLQLELARGTLNRLRHYVANLEATGIAIPQNVAEKLSEAMQLFARAATSRETPEVAVKAAEDALQIAVKLAFAVAAAGAEQTLARRHLSAPKLATLFGANLGDEPLPGPVAAKFVATFNSAAVPFTWSKAEPQQGRFNWTAFDAEIDWCQKNNLRVCGGPIVELAQYTLPHWLYLWEGDLENLSSLMCNFAQHVVQRYKGKVNVWNCSSRLNVSRELKLSEDQRLALAVRLIQVVRQTDPHTPVVISFDQPWGEYMASADLDLAPIHFADALVRGGLGLTGICLEINCGFQSGATLARDPLEVAAQLDRWTTLGLPLMVTLCVPGGRGEDKGAVCQAMNWPQFGGVRDGFEAQLRWVERFVTAIVSKITVQVLMWSQLRDDQPHRLAHGGLFDVEGNAKPALESLAHFRRAHLT